MNGIRSEMFYDEVLTLSSKIAAACCDCESTSLKGDDRGADRFRRNLTELFLGRFSLTLHGTFASRARKSPPFEISMKAYLDSALAILAPRPDKHFQHLMLVGGGLFKNSFYHAALAVSSELMTQAEDVVHGSSTKRQARCRLETLKDAAKMAIPLAATRIRHGETNVKLHVVLCMALSYALALEAGASVEMAMAKSAKESLEQCYSLILARVDSSLSQTQRVGVELGNEATVPDTSGFYSCFYDLWENTDAPITSFY